MGQSGESLATMRKHKWGVIAPDWPSHDIDQSEGQSDPAALMGSRRSFE